MMQQVRVGWEELVRFTRGVFLSLGAGDEEAADSADILVAADAKGIVSHGTARLRRYVNGVLAEIMVPRTPFTVLQETPISLTVDANGAMGLHVSKQVMERVIRKAHDAGAAFASVRDSNHFGIAGYYAQMALEHDMIGIAMTNTAALGVPTFGREVYFGTNPIAVAVPASREAPFILDMSTTVVTRGKVETYAREGGSLPNGWAVDIQGLPTGDASTLLNTMLHQLGGGILPLGGSGELHGGHKGYGLAVLVDICTALFSGGTFGRAVMDSAETSARVCHFFGAVRIDRFRKPDEFKADMDRMLADLVQAVPAEGEKRIFYAGLKEHLHEEECRKLGIPLSVKVYQQLLDIADQQGVMPPEKL